MQTITMFVAVVAGLIFYLLPTISAAYSQHRHTPSIFLINLLLGWTLLGWVICLAWSCSEDQ